MLELVIGLLLVIVIVLAFKKSHPADMKGLGNLVARKCPTCRTKIHDRAIHCPHCGQPTGVKSKRTFRSSNWEKLAAKRDWQ